MLKVYKQCCKNCLLSKNRIVSPQRAKEIISDCSKKQTHFICHKASMNDEEVVCRSFYDKVGYVSQMVRIAQCLNAVEFVEQPDTERLTSYEEIRKSKVVANGS